MRLARGVLHPEGYHGATRKGPFFEAWYVKVSTEAPARTVVFIPGIFRGRDQTTDHAFIQVIDDATRRVTYHRFPVSAFRAAEDRFDVHVGDNAFSSHGLRVVLDGMDGRLEFDGIAPWPVTVRSPGIMGWYAWLPVMQCYHAVVSLDHGVRGTLQMVDECLSFTGGRGYIEKDWGRSFPRAWIWMQSNHFCRRGVCLTASIADVPWFAGSFPGFLVGLYVDDHLHRFTTYTGARITRLDASPRAITLTIEEAHRQLELVARGGQVARIHVPSETDMTGLVDEHVGGTLEVRLIDRHAHGGRELVFEGTGRQASYEAHGDLRGLERLAALEGAR